MDAESNPGTPASLGSRSTLGIGDKKDTLKIWYRWDLTPCGLPMKAKRQKHPKETTKKRKEGKVMFTDQPGGEGEGLGGQEQKTRLGDGLES